MQAQMFKDMRVAEKQDKKKKGKKDEVKEKLAADKKLQTVAKAEESKAIKGKKNRKERRNDQRKDKRRVIK